MIPIQKTNLEPENRHALWLDDSVNPPRFKMYYKGEWVDLVYDTGNVLVMAHMQDYSNPHKVNKEQIGLSKVQNIAPEDMPISNAVQEALDTVKNYIDSHLEEFKIDTQAKLDTKLEWKELDTIDDYYKLESKYNNTLYIINN
jgi:hypothetical protein